MIRRTRPPLPKHLRAQLDSVEPSVTRSGIEYHPCEVRLLNGSVMSRVYVVNAVPWFNEWGVDPEDDLGKSGISIAELKSIRDSPVRLPPTLATEIYRHPEVGMGLRIFQIGMRNGDKYDCRTSEAVDFLDWPSGIRPRDAVSVRYAVGNGRSMPEIVDAAYSWALYQDA